MLKFTKTELTSKVAEVFRATFKEPVIITDRNKDSHVIMTIEDYEELIKKKETKEET